MSAAMTEAKKKRISPTDAWRDARELIWAHRYRLGLGMVLMIVNRLAGLVLPASSKYVIDDVILKHRSELLVTGRTSTVSVRAPWNPSSDVRCLFEIFSRPGLITTAAIGRPRIPTIAAKP